jgi:hypothetical protein
VIGQMLVRRTLKPTELALLVEVLRKRSASLLPAVDRLNIGVSHSELREVCDLLTEEFVASGLDDNDAPTQRGLMLEDLIDVLNPFTDVTEE